MAEALNLDLLTAARAAAAALSEDCSRPSTVEANMDVLSTALLKLLPTPARAKEGSPDLCEVLKRFVALELLKEESLTCCRGIEELIQVADYDISDDDQFDEEVTAEIGVLQEDLENAFAKLEKRNPGAEA